MRRFAFCLLIVAACAVALMVDESEGAVRCTEDSACWVWPTMGNLDRGVTLKSGRKAVVDASQFCRLERKRSIDWKKTPKLKGDQFARQHGCDGRLFAQPASVRRCPRKLFRQQKWRCRRGAFGGYVCRCR